MRIVALDFETTGPAEGWPNEPWQLGMVELDPGSFDVIDGTMWETFFRIDPKRPFSPRALGRWAGMRDELAAAPALYDIWPEVAKRLSGAVLVAHNAGTERTLLTRIAPLSPWGPWTDTLTLAKRHWPNLSGYRLSDVAGAFGLAERLGELLPGRTWHDALYDAVAGALVYSHIRRMFA